MRYVPLGIAMIARFFGKLAALIVRGPGRAGPQDSWSIRVPCPGGKAASTVGCGTRVPSAAALFASGLLSGFWGATHCSGALGIGAVIIVIGNILFVASDHDRPEAND
jgi:hypothetical protein